MISNCPKCAGQVTMPRDGKPDWQVKCPLCQQEFSLGEMLEKLPPALIVVSAPPVPVAVAATADDEFATLFAGEAERTATGDIFELDSAERETPSFTLAGSDARPAVATAPSTSTVTALPRRKKKEKKVVAELVKIVLGGIAGLLIGFFLLLWVWKKDVLGVAPKFPAWAQWALPADLRTAQPNVTPASGTTADANKQEQKPEDSSTENPSDNAAAKDDARAKPDATAVAKDGETTTDAVPPADDANKQAEKPALATDDAKEVPKADRASSDKKPADDAAKVDAPKVDVAKKEKPIDQNDPLDIRPPDADKKSELPTLDEPKLDDPLKPKAPTKKDTPPDDKKPAGPVKPGVVDPLPDATDEKKPAEKKPDQPDAKEDAKKKDAASDVGLTISESSTPEQVETALAAATEAEKVLTPVEPAQKSAFTPEKYAAFGKVCEAVSAITRAGDDPPNVEKVNGMVAGITSDDEHATVVGQLANAWLTRSRKNDGIVLVGKVEEVSGEGPLKTAKIQLPALGTKLPAIQVTVVAKELPELKPQDAVAVTGMIVEKPADAIKGYKGENKRVVWAASVSKRD